MGLTDIVRKSAVYGVVGAVIPGILANIPSRAMIRVNALGGNRVPAWLLGAIGAIGASLLSDLAHSYIKPEIDNKHKFLDQESLVMGTVIGGLTLPMLFYVANRNIIASYGFLNLAAVGAGSELVGTLINSYMM